MKYIYLTYFLIFTSVVYSQEDSVQVEEKKASFGISLSPNYSYRNQVDEIEYIYDDIAYLGKDNEVGQFGHTMN
ncbi:MAG: hypothetical protein JKX68_06270, partial [Flavobacteriales bacterium]|nr:hypothetical protein [Flavobacteriales bacterium]